MTEQDNQDPRLDRIKDPDGAKSEAWVRTLETMREIAADRQDDGWDALTLQVNHTDTVSVQTADHDDYGFFHVVPGNYADDFEAFWDEDFSEYLVYGTSVGRMRYLVTEFLDPEQERAVVMAWNYDSAFSNAMFSCADEKGVLYSYMRRMNGERLGRFEYEEYEPLRTHPGA